MNREIKFRAYDLEEKEMFYNYLDKNWLSFAINSPFVELMQYTGLKDKKGVDIYEGDILEWDGNIGKVVFENCAFQLDCSKYKLGYLDLGRIIIHGTEECKPLLIGNIYENLELLK